MGFHVGKVSVKSMVISTNRISLTFDDTEKMEKIGVSVPDAREGGISRISNPGATMDCTVQEAGNDHIVYTEAEARQLHTDDGVWTDDSQMSPADFISRCMTGEDARALSGEHRNKLHVHASSKQCINQKNASRELARGKAFFLIYIVRQHVTEWPMATR